MESLNVKNINDEKIFNVIDPNGQGEVVNRIRPISISINQKAQTINDQTDSTINLAVYWNDTWKSILDLTFDESLRQEYGKLVEDLTTIQKDIDMKQYKDAETKTADFLKYVANLSSKYTAIPETTNVAKVENDFISIKAEKNSVKATISDKLLNFMLKKYAKVDNLDYTKSNECFSTSKFNCLANNYDIYYHSPEIFQKQAYMTVVKDNKVVGSYKVNYDQFSKFASKFMLTPQKLGYSKDRLAGYMKTAEVVMQNIFFDSVDEAKEWQEMVDEKKKEQATSPEGEEETTEIKETKTKTEIGEGKSESPVKEDGGLARPDEDFASDEIPESEPRQQEQQGGGQNLGASRRVNLLKKKAGVRQTQKINNTINDIKQYYNELNQKSKEELMKIVMETYYKDLYNDVGEKDKKILEKKFLENENEEIWKQRLIKDKYTYDKGYDFAFENWGPDEQNINEEILALLNRKMIPEEFYKGVLQGLMAAKMNDIALQKERNRKRRQKYHETKEEWKDIGKMYGESSKEKNLTKKATVGYNAEPENELEEKVIEIGDEIMGIDGKYSNQIVDLAFDSQDNPNKKEENDKKIADLKDKLKKEIKVVIDKNKVDFTNKEFYDLFYEHLQDNNFHTANKIIEELLNGKQASKKVKLNKKAKKEYVVTDEWQEKNSKGVLVTQKMEEKLSAEELIDFAKERWDPDYEDEEITDLDSAIKWLEENGFKVSKQANKNLNLNKKAEEKLYKYEELSEKAKERARSAFSEDDHSWFYEDLFPEDQDNLLKEKYAQYNVELENLDVEWDNYNRCTVNLKDKFAYWDAFRTIWVDCAKQVLKDLPMFANNAELLEDWATEAASDMYFQHDHFEVYSGLNDIDDQNGTELSYKISDLCTKAYEEKVEPILSEIAGDFEDILQKQEDYFYSEEYVKDECAVREILFDEEGNIVKEGKKRKSLNKNAKNKILANKRKAKKLNKKALYGDVQEQDTVPAKTETKVYLQSEDKGNKKQLPNFSVTVRRNSDDEVVDIIECNNQKEAEETYKYMLSDLDKDCYVSINKLVGKEEYTEIKNSSLIKEESCKKKAEEKAEDFVWLINSSGRIEILAPKALVMGATGSGDNSEGVEKLRDYIKKDLEKISVEEMQKTVSEYGVDNVKEMDKDELERYLVWLLAGDTADNIENRLADKEDLENIKAKTTNKMKKSATDYKGEVAELLDEINEPDVLVDYISEDDAKKICKELNIPHEAEWYKGDLRGYIDEIPDGMVDVLIEYISESDAEHIWRQIQHDLGNDASKKTNVKKNSSDKWLEKDTEEYMKKDIEGTKAYLEKYLKEKPELFKAQYGVETVEEALKLLKEKNPNWYKKAEEQMVEEKKEEQVADDTVKGKIGVGDIVAINFDNVISSEDFPKYEEFIGKPLILMENDKEDITKVIVEQTEYPFQRITVDNKDVVMYEGVKGEDVIVEDVDGDEMITTFEELPIVAKQCKIKSIHKAANINKKKANLTKKAINSLEDVAGLIDAIWSDYDWYEYADALEVGETSHYENILADLQKDEKGAIEGILKLIEEDDNGYTAPEIEQLKEYYNAKFGGK